MKEICFKCGKELFEQHASCSAHWLECSCGETYAFYEYYTKL